jgi:hypothetical protein
VAGFFYFYMASKSKQNQQNQQQQNYWQAQTQNAYQATAAPDPLEEKFKKQSSDRLDWEAGARDINDPRAGLQDVLQIGKAAQERAQQERYGTGALQLGGEAGYADKLKALKQAEMGEDFGTSLEQANMMRHAEATGNIMPLLSLDAQRRQSRLGFAGQMTSSYLNAPKEVPFWKQLVMGAVQGGSAMGSAFLGKP